MGRAAGWLRFAAVPLAGLMIALASRDLGADAISYWLPDPIGRYALAEQSLVGLGPFRYTPVMALPVLAFGMLPWAVFLVLWTVALAASVAWLVTPRWFPVALAVTPAAYAIALGNVTVLTASAIVIGMRYPVAWCLPLLTKVTPGIGLLWFLVRGQWRSLLVVGLVAGSLSVLAELVLPGSWDAWWRTLREQAAMADPTMLPRLLIAAAIVVFAARTDRAWLLPVAVFLASARLGWGVGVVLLAIPRLASVAEERDKRHPAHRPLPREALGSSR